MKTAVLIIMLTIAAVVAIALCTGCASPKTMAQFQADEAAYEKSLTQAMDERGIVRWTPTPQGEIHLGVKSTPTPTRLRVKPQTVGIHPSRRHGFNLKASIKKWCADQLMVIQGSGPSTESWVYALFQAESGLNPTAKGPGGEYGLGQVTPWSAKYYGDILVEQGHKRGSIKDPDWQVALAVCELKQKDTRGIEIAVRRYNGSGPRARKHLAKVKEKLRQLRLKQGRSGQ